MRILHVVAKVLLTVAATAAGAWAGGAIGVSYVAAVMPNAGLDGLPPAAFAAFVGSVVGAFAVLSVLFKLPRLGVGHLTALASITVVGAVVGLAGHLAIRPDTTDPAWGPAALSGWGFAVLAAVVAIASTTYGRREARTA